MKNPLGENRWQLKYKIENVSQASERPPSVLRMFLYILEASASANLIPRGAILGMAAIILLPLTAFLMFACFIMTLVSLPYLLLPALLLSVYMYRKNKNAPGIWIAAFGAMACCFSLILQAYDMAPLPPPCVS